MGYRTDVVEFTSTEHTARNLMIRAVRALPPGDPAFIREYQQMKQFWGVEPYIEGALGEQFVRFLPGSQALPGNPSREAPPRDEVPGRDASRSSSRQSLEDLRSQAEPGNEG